MKRMNWFYQRRAELAAILTDGIKELPGISTPKMRLDSSNIWHLYIIEIDKIRAKLSRDRMIDELKKRNIGTSVHFIPLHRHPAYRGYGGTDENLPVSAEVYPRILSLPLYPKMSDQDTQDVTNALTDILVSHS